MLLKIARSRLKFTGEVIIQVVTPSEVLSPEFGSVLAMTSSNDDTSQHLIKYVESGLDDSGMFHELCYVKLNEIGFKKVEIGIGQNLLSCPTNEEREEMKKAIVYVAEVYANFFLFKYFKEESKSDRDGLDSRFLVDKAIRIIVRESGFFGIVSAAGHRISKRWTGNDIDDDFKWAFEEAFKRKNERETYTKIYLTLSKLPLIRETSGGIQSFTDQEIDLIKECVLELFRMQLRF